MCAYLNLNAYGNDFDEEYSAKFACQNSHDSWSPFILIYVLSSRFFWHYLKGVSPFKSSSEEILGKELCWVETIYRGATICCPYCFGNTR